MREAHGHLAERGAQVVAVSPDEPSETAVLVADLGLPFAVLSDRRLEVASAFGAAAHAGDVAPSAFLLDRRGRVRWSHVGHDPTDQPSLAAVLAAFPSVAPLPVPAPSSVLTPAVAGAVATAFALLAVLAAVANMRLLSWDEPLRDALRDLDDEWLSSLMRNVTELGSRWTVAALSLPMAALAWRRCRQLAVVIVAAFFAALALELVLKAVVDRPRPPDANGFGNSFPSGHVLAAVAFWGLVPPWTYVLTRRRWTWAASVVLAVIAMLAVTASRVYLGNHWPSDVVGGLLGGAVFLLAAEWAVRRPSVRLRCDACDLHPLRTQDAGTVDSPPD